MERFKGNEPLVKKLSQSLKSGRHDLIDKETGFVGAQIAVLEVKWINDNEVEIGGLWEAWDKGSSVRANKYRMTKENGEWAIKGYENIVVF
jgi:hypothetical protein